ncbi:uncharacterized protein ATNIH1004_000670 [Aspergillus tanneri]|uniref:Zn(2)-C6 fungal-type domain-containing protein n=1 Tax=Aspergillus tanneri TaxID=1220188 RepID=A0A5M9N2J9_9EURO|nr:uncharacterized protein ATNIH1004_000670 [Aspergillus tanneri]KAA8651774.1 hypothetical protein ATNIH1004_000670 [Aspergillus tanneri]
MAVTRTSKSQRTAVRASLACVQCRSQHAKCGAEMPVCSRCQQEGRVCYYVQSRRSATAKASVSSLPASDVRGDVLFSPPSAAHAYSVQENDSIPIKYGILSAVQPLEAMNGAYHGESEHATCCRFLDAYYRETDSESITFLLPVIHYIGSVYINDGSATSLKETVIKQLNITDLTVNVLPSNGYTVLAFLLLAIATYGQDDRAQARILLNRGLQMMIDIGMNRRTFAAAEPDPSWAESWRRTFWGLYTTDVLIVGLCFCGGDADVDLPSDDITLDQARFLCHTRTFEQYEIRDFEDKVPVFSSFTYLIDLVKIAHSVLHPREDRNTAATNADTMLIAWKLNLPLEKHSVVKEDGGVDHILFHCHVLWHSLLITIHQPLSRLVRSSTRGYEDNALISPISSSDDSLWEDSCERLHTRRTLDAVAATMNLCALPIPIVQQSPLTISCVALSTMTSMMEYQTILSSSPRCPTRDKTRLGVAILNQFGQVWAMGANASTRMKKIAREVFTKGHADRDGLGRFELNPILNQSLLSVADPWAEFSGVNS